MNQITLKITIRRFKTVIHYLDGVRFVRLNSNQILIRDANSKLMDSLAELEHRNLITVDSISESEENAVMEGRKEFCKKLREELREEIRRSGRSRFEKISTLHHVDRAQDSELLKFAHKALLTQRYNGS